MRLVLLSPVTFRVSKPGIYMNVQYEHEQLAYAVLQVSNGPFNVSILLNGWICLHCVLD